MTTYVDVFGGDAVPPSQSDLNIVSITADATMYWPFEYSGVGIVASDIIEITSDAPRSVTLPAANSAGKGAGFVLRNTGAYTLTALDGAGGALTTIGAGVAKYFYIEQNTTVAGIWSVLTWGTGTSAADANSLVSDGLTVLSGKLATGVEVVESASSLSITSAHRSKLVVNTGGTVTFTLAEATTLGSNFFITFRNSGSGALTIATTSSQTIDAVATITINPGETASVVRNGTSFYSFGQGRSVNFNYGQTNYSTSATAITVTSGEAAGTMLNFVGNPAGTITVTLPSVASIYYVYNNTSTAQSLLLKTSGVGSTTTVPTSQRAIVFCDALNVVSAQSPATSGAVQFTDGSATNPAVTFSADTDTGLYRVGANTIGVTVNGALLGSFDSTGWTGYVSGISPTILGYLSTISSNVQTQISAKQATITGAATTIASADLTINRALASDASGKVAVSAVTTTELGYLTGVTSAIQTQLNAKQPLDATLTGLAALGEAGNNYIPVTTGTNVWGNLLWNASTALGTATTTLPSESVVKTYADTKNIDTQVAPGANGNIMTVVGGVWASAAAGAVTMTLPTAAGQYYTGTSAAMTVGATDLFTFAHGLGAAPKLVTLSLQAVNANNNWSIGDIIYAHDTSTNDGRVIAYADATNVYVRTGTVLGVTDKTSGLGVVATKSDWKVVVRAWK